MKGAAALAALGLAIAACASSGRPTTPPPWVEGQALALVLPDLDARPVDLGGARGEVRVIDFWASWCEPCKLALPELETLAHDLGGRGLRAYAVSIDQSREALDGFLTHTPLSIPVLWDQNGVELGRFDVRFMPVTFVVDRRGVVRHVYQGWTRSRPAEQRAEVERLLME